MKIIGITGGVGSGKSALLSYIEKKCRCRIILADEAAHKVREPGQPAYRELVSLLGSDVLDEDGAISRPRMAEKIFASDDLRKKVNALIHPAVKEYILAEIKRAETEKKTDWFFIEAALLIENGYLAVVDEMWYIYAKEEVRRRRLKTARGYTDEKIDAILKSQLAEDEFRAACSVVIDNSGELEEAYRQIDGQLTRGHEKMQQG